MHLSEKITLITIFVGLVTAFITAGGAGFLNLIILQKLGVLKLGKKEEQEKKFFVLLFSVVNFAIFLAFMGGLESDNIEIITLSTKTVIWTIIKTLSLSAIGSFTLLPIIAVVSEYIINLMRTKIMKITRVSNRTPKELIFEKNKNILVYVFSLDNNFIGKGYLTHWGSDELENGELVLSPPASNKGIEINEVRELFLIMDVEDQTISPKHLIDSNNKIQYFVFYQ